jgi:hypothetical protein
VMWRGHFTESPDPHFRAADGVHTVFYRRLVKAMAAFHGVAATEEQVLQARSRLRNDQLVAALLSYAAIEGSSSTRASPIPASSCRRRRSAGSAMADRSPCCDSSLFQQLVAEHGSYDDCADAVRAGLADVRASGHVGCKSIAAYRTGLVRATSSPVTTCGWTPLAFRCRRGRQQPP